MDADTDFDMRSLPTASWDEPVGPTPLKDLLALLPPEPDLTVASPEPTG